MYSKGIFFIMILGIIIVSWFFIESTGLRSCSSPIPILTKVSMLEETVIRPRPTPAGKDKLRSMLAFAAENVF